ncbi:SIR2 family protein [Mycobacterium sp. UM_CSW]|uniref:SIR2 family NAD-dependent protein deacylase n=1 Tax=Mycobacterium sp. UM_CSW TaxID=1370119 RepID=UPI0009DBAB8A|nr:SIR2 family protein [Mycobacterium sp. UM_CSW]
MAIPWSQSLLTEIAERRCVLVLGSGASASSVNVNGVRPPGWVDFLQRGIDRIDNGDDRSAAEEQLQQRAFLDAAQILVDALGSADFGLFLRQELEDPGFQPSELHQLVLRIDPKIVITTNYDRIYESLATQGAAAAGYNVCRYYEGHLVNDLRSTRRLIVKAHGCVSDPQKVVLTRRQYFTARRDYPQFFAALDAIFLTSTLLFIGSGFNGDPDIELLLQNVNISAPSQHTHFAIVEAGRHLSVRRAIEETHNIKFLEYPAGQHGEVVAALRDLADSVDSYRAVS